MLGSRMRRLRLARGMTQKELAAPKYSYAYVSTIEAGRRSPSKEAIEHFASRLGVTADELVTGRPADLAPRLELSLLEARVALSAGQLEESDRAFQSIAKDAKRYHLHLLQARTELGRGLQDERRSQPEDALAHYERAEELVSTEVPTDWVDAVAGKARCFEALGDVRYSIFLLESLLDRLEREKLRDPDALCRLHASLVFAYLDAGIYRKAAESGAELAALAPRLTDPLRIAQMHMNVARLHLHEGRVADAQHSLRRAQETYRHLNLKTEMGGAHLALGYVASREHHLEEARSELAQAVTIFEETSNAKDLTRALNELARVERLEGFADRAKALLERSIALTGDSDAPILAWAYRELGFTMSSADPSAAEKHFRMAIELYERSEQASETALTYRALGALFDERGDAAAASDAYRTGIMALEPAV
ncbi:MAG: helix-turn-helix domain-containing protein [Actinomycetota bacterium]